MTMNTTTKLSFALWTLTACPPEDQTPIEGSSTSGSTGTSMPTNSSTGPVEVPEGSSSTGEPEEGSTTGELVGSSSEGSSTGANESTSSSTGEESTGEGSSSEGSSSTGELIPVICGNWAVEPGERCDDGNTENGDGCSKDCQRYDYFGIDTEVKEEELVGWEPCWSGPYYWGMPVDTLWNSCSGASQLMFACRKYGYAKYNAVAHTITSDISTKVETPQDYTLSNGSAWMYYAPNGYGYLAVGDPYQFSGCNGGYGLCWPIHKGMKEVFDYKGHCGSNVIDPYGIGGEWEKVVLRPIK